MTRVRRLARTLAAGVVDGVRAARDLLAWGEVQQPAGQAGLAGELRRGIDRGGR